MTPPLTLLARLEAIEEVVSRTCDIGGGTRVTNCVQHMSRDLLERPTDCHLCAADVQNQLRKAIAINGWLNTWKDDAEPLLREAAAAIPVEAEGRATGWQEQCICAAIRLPNGEVWRGHRHDNCIQVAGAASVPREQICEAEQGFMTSENRFVGREVGAMIQRKAGIVSASTGKLPEGMLFSEDLYLRLPAPPARQEPSQ